MVEDNRRKTPPLDSPEFKEWFLDRIKQNAENAGVVNEALKLPPSEAGLTRQAIAELRIEGQLDVNGERDLVNHARWVVNNRRLHPESPSLISRIRTIFTRPQR